MSEQGVGAAVMLFFIMVLGLIGTIAIAVLYDLHRKQVGGDDATETYGVRYLVRHAPWLVFTAALFLWGTVMFAAGFLVCHLFATPLWQP